jgi:hypothetical protein
VIAMPGHLRQRVLAAALILTLAATIWVSANQDTPAEPVAMSAQKAKAPSITSVDTKSQTLTKSGEGIMALHGAHSRTTTRNIKDLFASMTWIVPPVVKPWVPKQSASTALPPVPQVVHPPPPPPAPPLPFKYLGRLQDGKGPWQIILLKDNKVYIAREGDILDGTFRITNIGNDQINIMNMPLHIEQFLASRGGS